jgi:2,5-diamino-6-(ribosylamino)-4(3H)-pyrimidinone 5'-phosphate reductase
MSLDGKIATSTGDSKLSSPEDLKRVHKLRASVDGVMVGKGTLLADDPKLTVRLVSGRNPQRIIVDSMAQTPLNARVVKTSKQVPTIVGVSALAPTRRIRALEKAGVTVLRCGRGPRVSLSNLLHRLRARGIGKILLEGGGTLNWSMLSEGLVDEVSVAVSPRILGGEKAVSLVEGQGVALTKYGIRLRLVSISRFGTDVVLRYRMSR